MEKEKMEREGTKVENRYTDINRKEKNMQGKLRKRMSFQCRRRIGGRKKKRVLGKGKRKGRRSRINYCRFPGGGRERRTQTGGHREIVNKTR